MEECSPELGVFGVSAVIEPLYGHPVRMKGAFIQIAASRWTRDVNARSGLETKLNQSLGLVTGNVIVAGRGYAGIYPQVAADGFNETAIQVTEMSTRLEIQ
jgi:hypothetical protein